MKRFIKILTSLLLIVLIAFGAAAPVAAVRFGDVAAVPNAFWGLSASYNAASNAGDSAGVVRYGRQIIEFWLAGHEYPERAAYWGSRVGDFGFIINSIWATSNYVGYHYARLGDLAGQLWAYGVALAFVDPYQALIIYEGIGYAGDMEFARTRILNTINALDVEIMVFAELWDSSGDLTNFDAKHAPPTGLFFGEPANVAIKDGLARPSATMIYVEFEHRNLQSRVLHDLALNEQAGFSRNDYSLIQIGWNFYYQGASLSRVFQEEAMIVEDARFLNSLGLPFLLRIAGEMNVWSTPADPDEYIAAFRFIADIMRREAPNVALLWAPNFISAHGLDMHMFYPGDDYVDWVGLSLYTHRYFQGNPNTSDADAAIWSTGQFANPIAFVRYVVEQFGDRKPIIISEGGVQLQNRPTGEDTSRWAMPIMRQVYNYIPILFPQVKAMFWFNVDIATEASRFDFGASPSALSLYRELTTLPHFIQQGQIESAVSYGLLGTATMPANAVSLLTYAPFFSMENVSVWYAINGEWLDSAHYIPYRVSLDLSALSDGRHSLTVQVFQGQNVLQTKEFTLIKEGAHVTITDGGINVSINGLHQSFEVPPQLISGRSMVPLRAIAEALGMEVGHDATTNSALLTKPGVHVSHAIGSYEITVNGIVQSFDVASQLVDGRTLMPVRMLAEAIGAEVDWNPVRQMVVITTN